MRKLLVFSVVSAGLLLLGLVAAWWVLMRPVELAGGHLEIVVRPGSSPSTVARQLRQAGVSQARWLPWLARVTGRDRSLKAGRYRLDSGRTVPEILDTFVAGKVEMSSLIVIEGWTFARLKEAIRANPDIEKTVVDGTDDGLLRAIGASESHPEGLFFPDTYLFASGSTDVSVLRRAYQAMKQRLAAAWDKRSPAVPYGEPYEALVMASIVEKETSRPSERGLVASVFVNRLRLGMRLQSDPAVIYGLGDRFDGNLRRQHLESDGSYNTYTRGGLPPTPIALPGYDSLEAATQPPATRFLYFVARGDGSSEFSTNLPDHNRAVDRYQRASGGPRS